MGLITGVLAIEIASTIDSRLFDSQEVDVMDKDVKDRAEGIQKRIIQLRDSL